MLFNHTASELTGLCGHALDLAKNMGAAAAEADFSESIGQSVSVRLGEIEQIEFQQDKSLDITVYVGKRKGRASTADFSDKALVDTVRAAIDIARYTAEDDCAGLADADLMADKPIDLDRYHEWDLSAEEAAALAKQCEQAALDSDERIENSEGADVQTGHYQYVYGNSHGFMAHQQGTRHGISCSVVAADEQGMERSRGIEFNAYANLLNKTLRPTFGLMYLQSTVKNYPNSRDMLVSGVQVANPRVIAKAGVEWDTPFAKGLTLNGNVSYFGKSYQDTQKQYAFPSYTLVDVGARYKTKLGKNTLTVSSAVENLFNKNYWQVQRGQYDRSFAVVGMPRTYWLKAELDF